MIPELSNNPTFLRYYEILRDNPSSIVFAPLAELLIMHKFYQEAITICKKGLEKNPDIITGRLAIARAYVGVKNYERAFEEAKLVLVAYPDNLEAIEITNVTKGHIGAAKTTPESLTVTFATKYASPDSFDASCLNPATDKRWYTVTMADIYLAQGNYETAKKIYMHLIEKEPNNKRVREGLDKLEGIQR